MQRDLCTGKPFAEKTAPTELVAMAEELKGIALTFGIGFEPAWLEPLALELMCKDEPFRRGVLTTVAHLVDRLALRPQGRKALADLGFEPVLQKVESPGGTGFDD